jgi:putative lipoic acid-binding regulatory protein
MKPTCLKAYLFDVLVEKENTVSISKPILAITVEREPAKHRVSNQDDEQYSTRNVLGSCRVLPRNLITNGGSRRSRQHRIPQINVHVSSDDADHMASIAESSGGRFHVVVVQVRIGQIDAVNCELWRVLVLDRRYSVDFGKFPDKHGLSFPYRR